MTEEIQASRSGYERCAHLYDMFDTKDNIPFFYAYAEKHDRVLDIGAGTGRIAIPLAQKGIRMHCIEPSPAMRKVFRQKLQNHTELKPLITIKAGNAVNFKCKGKFPLALLSGVFDHLLDEKEQIAALANIYSHLEPRGKFVFDIFLGSNTTRQTIAAGKYKKGDFEYRRYIKNKKLPDNKTEVTLIYDIYEHGTLVDKIKETSLVRSIHRNNLHTLLKTTGFSVIREFGDFQKHPFTKHSPMLIVETEKTGDT